MQRTVAGPVLFAGIGVHGGLKATATVRSASAGSGISFRRTDVATGDNVIPARFDNVVDTRLCTVLANKSGVKVSTVEHIMAALSGLGVDNAMIDVDGPEAPIMDGSSAPFVEGIRKVGIVSQDSPRPAIEILRRVEVREGDKVATLSRSRNRCFEMRFEIDFADAAIGRQERSLPLVNGAFVDELCRARTFGRLAEVEQLRAVGLARGGSLANAIVVDGDKVLNEDGLRYDDEFVRHKMLDAVGDLYLAGAPIIGAYRGVRAGHDLTNKLLHKLFADATAYRIVEDDLSVFGGPSQRLGAGVFAAA